MFLHWFLYSLSCLLSTAFYIAHGEWLSWYLLLCVFFLPVISFLLSIPSILLTKAEFACPTKITMGTSLCPTATLKNKLPMPPVQWTYCAHENFTGEKFKVKGDRSILADHCGCIRLSVKRAWAYDYLGLVRHPISRNLNWEVLVYPTPVPTDEFPPVTQLLAGTLSPKSGEGVAEDYDLRDYRAGDDLRRIHWKLSVKTNNHILREPMVRGKGSMIIALNLMGDSDYLDQLLGKVLYVSRHLLKKALPHQIHCMTGEGLLHLQVDDIPSHLQAIERILRSTPSTDPTMPIPHALWLYNPGGASHEV